MQKFEKLTLGFSPCPNDIYLFYKFLENPKYFPDLSLEITDIHCLNKAVAEETIAFSKVSQYAACLYEKTYQILPVGNVFGFGYGPLLVSSESTVSLSEEILQKKGVAVAGEQTTGYLVMRMLFPNLTNYRFTTFSEIPRLVESQEVGFGVIIHESRETLENYGLHAQLDLGAAWQTKTGLPLPLGCLVAHRSLSEDVVNSFMTAVRSSMDYAQDHEKEVLVLAREYSQEKSLDVVKQHIKNYISPATYALTQETQQAIALMRKQVLPC